MTSENKPTPPSDSFPPPGDEAKAHSQKLLQHIRHYIDKQCEPITFAQFMNLALYAPGLGYYSAGLQKFGREGDFITAPEISPLFSQCLALQSIPILETFPHKIILEVGAGSGVMGIEIMQELERQSQLPEKYLILELSADLRDRQQRAIQAKIPQLFDRFQWLDRLPDKPFSGLVIANELLDAMPVHILKLENNTVYERYVDTSTEGALIWKDAAPSQPRLDTVGQQILSLHESQSDLQQQPGRAYITEVNLQAMDWVASIADILDQGAILLVDYGYTAQEYYHPQRHMGTLMCHYQHHRHDDPFYLPGLQDITAHVNFSAIAEAAANADLSVCGFTTQAHFLMAGGLVDLTKDLDPNDVSHFAEVARQIKMLTLPEEMGELFKVILLARNNTLSLPGFQFQDFRNRL
jgi:SAM-dependent MidA family methyltransferase